MRRVLVTGGAGFVGSHVCDALVASGHDVTVLDDLSRGSAGWLPDACEVRVADIRDAAAVGRAMREARPDAVVHLAALHFIPAVDDAPELAWAINVEGSRNVVGAAETVGTGTFVFASTAAVYPNRSDAIPESVAPDPIDLYGRTKLAGEHLVENLSARSGMRCISARLFNVIGPRETNPHVVPEIVEQVRRGVAEISLGRLDSRRDYVDVRDVADALAALALDAPAGYSVVNVGTGCAVSVAEIVATCERTLGRSLRVRRDRRRVRTVDRSSLVADITALVALGLRPRRDFATTLEELLRAPVEALA